MDSGESKTRFMGKDFYPPALDAINIEQTRRGFSLYRRQKRTQSLIKSEITRIAS